MSKIFNTAALRKVLIQCGRQLLLDRVEVKDDGTYAAVKNVSIGEPFFVGHFPGHPIMPGVLQIEAMKQLCEVAARPTLDPDGKSDVFLKSVVKAKFRRPVLPGDRVFITAEPKAGGEPGTLTYAAKCATAGGAASEATLTLGVRERKFPEVMPEGVDALDRGDASPMDVNRIMALMPHRHPFLHIDYLAKIEGEKVTAVKQVTENDAVFNGMPEDYHTLPESLLCEIAAQSGCACVLARPENAGKLGYFMAIDKSESLAPVFPGDRLVSEIILPPAKSKFGKGSCVMQVNGRTVFTITLMFAIVDP